MRYKIGATGFAVLVLAGIGAALWWSIAPVNPDRSSNQATESQETLEIGKQLYASNCARCHGNEGQGQPNWRERKADGKLPAPPLNGSGHAWHHPDWQLSEIISRGVQAFAPEGYKSDMEGFGGKLSDEEIDAVLLYLKQWWSPEIVARQSEITSRSRSKESKE